MTVLLTVAVSIAFIGFWLWVLYETFWRLR